MKNPSTDFVTSDPSSRKVIPMVIGSPRKAIKLVSPPLFPPSHLSPLSPSSSIWCDGVAPRLQAQCEDTLCSSPVCAPSRRLSPSVQSPVSCSPIVSVHGLVTTSAATPCVRASRNRNDSLQISKIYGFPAASSDVPEFGLILVVVQNATVQTNLSRGFCQNKSLLVLSSVDYANFVGSFVPVSVILRENYGNERVRLFHTFWCSDLTSFLRFMHWDLGLLGSTQCAIPSVYGLKELSCLIHWYDALYLYFNRRIFRIVFYALYSCMKLITVILAYGPLCLFVCPCYLFFSSFGWLFSLVIAWLPTFSNFLVFLSFVGSLYSLFSWSAIPLFCTCCWLLYRDYTLYGAMSDERQRRLSLLRENVLFILSRRGDCQTLLFLAYRYMHAHSPLPTIKKLSKKYYYDDSYLFGGKSCKAIVCFDRMYKAMLTGLELDHKFVTTADTSTSWYSFGTGKQDRWRVVGTTFQLVSGLCAHLPFGLGFYLNPVAGQFIQDAVLFIISYFYIATDTRAVKNVALACEFLKFRNSPLGITLDAMANEWLRDYMTETLEEIDKMVNRGLNNLDDFLGVPFEERATYELKGIPMGGPLVPLNGHTCGLDKNLRFIPYSSFGSYKTTSYQGEVPGTGNKFVPTSMDFSVEGLIKYLNGFDSVLRSQVTKKLLQVLGILIAVLSFSKSGSFTSEGMTRVIQGMRSQQFDESVDLLSYFVGLLKWLAETGWYLFRFPASSAFSPESSTQWKDAAEKLLLVERCAGFSECTGSGVLTVDGQTLPLDMIRTRVLRLIKIDWPVVEAALKITSSKFVLGEFKLLRNKLIVFESILAKKVLSQKYREQPFGVALTGGTSVGKSNVSNAIFAYLSALANLEHTPEMVFSRNPLTVFWDTFIGQRYILFDDVGSIHPQAKIADQSLVDILQVSNNAPYVVPMAMADDKGSQCVTSKAVIATSNQFNLNAPMTFACPAAVYRRFHVWTAMSVKPQFADRSGRLDSERVRRFWNSRDENDPNARYNRQFPPYWNFTVHATGDEVETDALHTFDDDQTSFLDYLQYIRQEYELHLASQRRVMESHEKMKTLQLCPTSKMPINLCHFVCCRPRSANLAGNDVGVPEIQPALNAAAPTFVPTMAIGDLVEEEEDEEFHFVERPAMEPLIEPIDKSPTAEEIQARLVDFYAFLVFGIVAFVVLQLLFYFELISPMWMVHVIVCHFCWWLFWLGILLHFIVSMVKQWFVTTQEACSITDTMYLPYWFIGCMFSRASSIFSDAFHFSYTFINGGCTREAFLRATLIHASRRIRKVVNAKNGIILLLIIAMVALAREPAYKILKTTFVMTMDTKPGPDGGGIPKQPDKPPEQDRTVSFMNRLPSDFQLPGKTTPVAETEDSKSAWYVPYPPADSRTDMSRCLTGASSQSFIENTIRRSTCNLELERKGKSSFHLRGLAIGGTMILTCAHAFYNYDGNKSSLRKPVITGGSVIFPSLIEGRSVKSNFTISDKNLYLNIEEDWAIIVVPGMAPRRSLVDYFLEKNHHFSTHEESLPGGGTVEMCDGAAHLVSPKGVNNFNSWCRRSSVPLTDGFPPGYMQGSSFFGEASVASGVGMSGSTLVTSAGGVSILGIQAMSDERDFRLVVSTFIGRTQLKDAIRQLEDGSLLNQFSSISRDYLVDENMRVPLMTSTPTRSNPLNFPGLEEWNFSFMYTLQQVVGSPSSNFAHPPYREFFRERGYICDKEKPLFDWKSKRHYLTQVSQISSSIDTSRVERISNALISHWIKSYGPELKLLVPLSLADAINGNDKVTWVERLKMDTSAGYPWNKRKLELLEVRPVPLTQRASGFEYSLPEKMHKQFCTYFFQLISRTPITYPYKGTQKDEAISPEKNKTRGPRLFCAANLYVIIAGRMLFGSYIRIAQRNPFISWAAVGMNAASKVWGTLWVFISRFGVDRIIAGDYSNFDQNMSPIFTSAAYAIIIALLRHSGNYSHDELSACQSWAFEAIYPTLIIDGDIFSIAGTNPSGNPLTVHINCIVNILFIMYVWVGVGNNIDEFFIYVRMMTYGDDNLIAVHGKIDNFNYWTIHVELGKIGVKYTPADKSQAVEGKQFDELKDIAFLKRTFEFREGFCFAPLDISSIAKTLNCWMRSKESDQKHGLATFMSIWENACHYDDELCDKIHSDITACCMHFSWPTAGFQSKEVIRERFLTAEVNRYDILSSQAEGEFQNKHRFVVTVAENPSWMGANNYVRYFTWPNGFPRFLLESRVPFHGLAFSIPGIYDSLTRWFSIQDGAWFQAMRLRENHEVPHGAGAFPLVEQELLDRHDEDQLDFGTYDSFTTVDGPGDDEFSTLPSGPGV